MAYWFVTVSYWEGTVNVSFQYATSHWKHVVQSYRELIVSPKYRHRILRSVQFERSLICWHGHILKFRGPCIVIHFYSKTNEMHQFLRFILFCSSSLYVWGGLSVHHQETKTMHTAPGVCQTDSADCLLAGTRWNISFPLASSQQNLFDIYLVLYV